MKNLNPIISAKELLKITDQENLVIIDASGGPLARENYENNHINNALFIDLNNDLSQINENPALGGRHPLPSLNSFTKTLKKYGIGPLSHVVVYDDKSGANAAARFWWMLLAVGHVNVQVLDGGLKAALEVGIEVNNKPVRSNNTNDYHLVQWNLPTVLMNEVEKITNDEQFIIIDVREKDRYLGKYEPIDLVAGHIPKAINIPYTSNLDDKGRFLQPEILKEKYENLYKQVDYKNVIVHCGSGVTACHTLLAFASAGLEIPKLYVGSWSEWSRNNKTIIKEL